jgi:hypothetical protein
VFNVFVGPCKLPQVPSERVDLRDLSWEDRERVLRLLFAKINNYHGYVDVLPKHDLSEEAGGVEDNEPMHSDMAVSELDGIEGIIITINSLLI